MIFTRVCVLLLGFVLPSLGQEIGEPVFILKKLIDKASWMICSKDIIPIQINVVFIADPKLSSPDYLVGDTHFSKEDQKYHLILCRSDNKRLDCLEKEVNYQIFCSSKIGNSYNIEKFKVDK
ncbi:MAG: hypothetical protein WC095_02270 [Candidatus Paceibacterota bacterium]